VASAATIVAGNVLVDIMADPPVDIVVV